MRLPSSTTLLRVLQVAAGLLVLKVTVSIVLQYGDYFPPGFESGFLQGRESYFAGVYQWAFDPHIFAGPVTLALRTLLVSDGFRRRWPVWHRVLGRIQVLVVLCLGIEDEDRFGVFAAARATAHCGDSWQRAAGADPHRELVNRAGRFSNELHSLVGQRLL